MLGDIRNKKGSAGIIIIFFLILLTILIAGFSLAIITGVVGYASDTITPIMKDVGVSSGEPALEQGMNVTFGVTNTMTQAMPWILGLAYVLALIFSIVFVVMYSYNPHPAFIGFYFVMVILLFFGSVVMSNMYQDIYTGTDELALSLQAQPIMSNMILYSPFYMVLIALITGIFMFAKPSQEDMGGGI